MIKYVRITMPDGSKWDIPAKVIMEDKQKRIQKAVENYNDSELIDWVENGIKWADVKRCAVKVINGSIDYQSGLKSGKKEIINK